MINKAVESPRQWEEDGLSYTETITIYLRLEKDGVEPTTLLLRPDEAQSIAWVASGAVWAHLMESSK
jgi:hypothetical protein